MRNKKIVGYFLFISIFSFIAIFVYLVQKSYSNLIGPISETKVSNLTKPIDPVLDVETINLIEQRKEYTQDSIVLPIPIEPTPSS